MRKFSIELSGCEMGKPDFVILMEKIMEEVREGKECDTLRNEKKEIIGFWTFTY